MTDPFYVAICTFLSSTFIGKVGFFQPWILVGSILQTIGVGLYYTWGLNTKLGPVIGFQIIYGIGAGLGVQASIIVGQSMSSIEDRSITLATICCKWIIYRLKRVKVFSNYRVQSSNLCLERTVSRQLTLF